MKWIFSGLAALSLSWGVAGPARSEYLFTTIDPPGSSEASATGINSAGQIVGQYGFVFGRDIGYLMSGGNYTPIDPPSASVGPSGATGINSSGLIVGSFFAGRTNHGYLLSGGSYTTLDVPGADETLASGINDAGLIVGSYFGARARHGFLLSGS